MMQQPPSLSDKVFAYKRGEISFDELKSTILARQFDSLPYPLWADTSDYSIYGFNIPGTWHEFIAFYEEGTLSHDEWWELAGEHPDWKGAKQEEPGSCDPTQGFIEWKRKPEVTPEGTIVATTTKRNGDDGE
jgi:hypothetical protein